MWEIITRKYPYDDLEPMQAVLEIYQKKLLPIPPETHPLFAEIMKSCWELDPGLLNFSATQSHCSLFLRINQPRDLVFKTSMPN